MKDANIPKLTSKVNVTPGCYLVQNGSSPDVEHQPPHWPAHHTCSQCCTIEAVYTLLSQEDNDALTEMRWVWSTPEDHLHVPSDDVDHFIQPTWTCGDVEGVVD